MRTTGIKQNLVLDKITGIRHDKGQKMTYVPVKKEPKLATTEKSKKTKLNKQGVWKYT